MPLYPFDDHHSRKPQQSRRLDYAFMDGRLTRWARVAPAVIGGYPRRITWMKGTWSRLVPFTNKATVGYHRNPARYWPARPCPGADKDVICVFTCISVHVAAMGRARALKRLCHIFFEHT